MAGLQRSEVSFRRQGSSGLVWNDKLLAAAMKQRERERGGGEEEEGEVKKEEEDGTEIIKEGKAHRGIKPIKTIERSRSNGGGRGHRIGNVSSAIEPPSPKVSACGFCSAFGKPSNKRRQRTQPVRRR